MHWWVLFRLINATASNLMTFCSTLFHFGGFWLPERLINLHLCNELTAHKLFFHYSAFYHKLQLVSTREHRFNLVLVDRSIETFLRLHLAFDHSRINCAINWGTRNRGLLLSCLANTFVLCVFGVWANILLHNSNSSAANSKTLFFHHQFQLGF